MDGATRTQRPFWQDDHSAYLNELAQDVKLSCRHIAAKINERFGTEYTRNSIVGRLHRLKIPKPIPPRPEQRAPRQRKAVNQPVFKIVANGGPGSLTIIKTSRNVAQLALRCVEIEPKHISILDLTDDTCRWPYQRDDFTFCGHQPVNGKVYCPAHDSIAYRTAYRQRLQAAE